MCIAAAQALLETFCTFSAQDLACAPVATFVRCGYAFIILMKVASTSALPNSVLGKLICPEGLRVGEYFNRALDAISQAAESDRSCMPARFARILIMLRSCHVKHMAEMGDERLHKDMTPCLLPLPPSPPPPSPPPLPPPPEPPSTPEAQQHASVAQSQTPLQLLAEQATFQLPLHSQGGQEQQQQQQQQQPFLEYQSPAGPFDPVAGAGFVDIRAGDTALGLGGPGRDVVTDDSFWGGLTGSGGVGMWPAVASEGWRF